MKVYVKSAHEVIYHRNVEIRYDTEGNYYAFIDGKRIEHPDLEELKRRINEILTNRSYLQKYRE